MADGTRLFAVLVCALVVRCNGQSWGTNPGSQYGAQGQYGQTTDRYNQQNPGFGGANSLQPFQPVYEWFKLDFNWLDEMTKGQALSNRRFIPENNVLAGIKVWRDRIFVTIPRLKEGVPVTIASLPSFSNQPNASPRLDPFPNWQMQEIGNCTAFQFVQSMEIDTEGRMWIIDAGRTNILTAGVGQPSRCPPKLVIIDLNSVQYPQGGQFGGGFSGQPGYQGQNSQYPNQGFSNVPGQPGYNPNNPNSQYGQNSQYPNTNNPNQPYNPSNPNQPFNPNNPNQAYNPSNPNQPYNPSNPNQQYNPSNPNQPYNPSYPNQPYNPSNPSQPYNPSNPTSQYPNSQYPNNPNSQYPNNPNSQYPNSQNPNSQYPNNQNNQYGRSNTYGQTPNQYGTGQYANQYGQYNNTPQYDQFGNPIPRPGQVGNYNQGGGMYGGGFNQIGSNFRIVKSFNFPSNVATQFGNYINDLVLDNSNGWYAYITDQGDDPGIIVYSFREDRAWKVKDARSMRSDPELSFSSINNIDVELRGKNIDGIALSPQAGFERTLYFSALGSNNLYSLPTSVLKNPNLPSDVSASVIDLGRKQSISDGMIMDNRGNLYFGLLALNAVGVWNSKRGRFTDSQRILARDNRALQWPDTFSIDDTGNLYVVTNRFQNYLTGRVNSDEPNYRILKAPIGGRSYLHPEDLSAGGGLPGGRYGDTMGRGSGGFGLGGSGSGYDSSRGSGYYAYNVASLLQTITSLLGLSLLVFVVAR